MSCFHVQLFQTFTDCYPCVRVCMCVCVCVFRSWPGSVRRTWGCWRVTRTKTTSLGSWRRRLTCWTEWVMTSFLLNPWPPPQIYTQNYTENTSSVCFNWLLVHQTSFLTAGTKIKLFFLQESIGLSRERHFLYVSVLSEPCGVSAPRRSFCWIKQNVKSVFCAQDKKNNKKAAASAKKYHGDTWLSRMPSLLTFYIFAASQQLQKQENSL